MRRSVVIWAILAMVYGVFLWWHTPRGEPLTAQEIAQAQTLGGSATPDGLGSADEMLTFLRSDDGRPFYMVNLMELRDKAIYPDGLHPEIVSSEDAALAYGRHVVPLLLARGSYPVVTTNRLNSILNSLGGEAAAYDTLTIVRYRSRRDLLDMITSDAFAEAVVHKWASLERTLVAPSERGFLIDLGHIVPVTLLVVGSVGTALGRRTRRAP